MQAAHPPPDGLCELRLEVRCPHTRQEAAGATIQVSSPCYGCPLVLYCCMYKSRCTLINGILSVFYVHEFGIVI